MNRKKLIIHTCCAICASEISERIKEGFEPIIFFCNPNIYEEEEYIRRRDSAKKLSEELNIPFFEDPYDRKEWLEKAGQMPHEPEGGKRCEECFRLRLSRAAVFTKEHGGHLTSTLAASPYKDEKLVGKIGQEEAEREGLIFIDPLQGVDKQTAWNKALKISKEAGYYRQKYCGCEFSDRNPRAK